MTEAVSWHPVPTRLVDEVMPRLKDTELRILLVVVRQTWGWRADGATGADRRHKRSDGRHKHRDWLSHGQLCRRTGRGSEAVSAAVASLVSSGLLVVEDAAGKSLPTPEERRRCLGRLYFRAGDGLTVSGTPPDRPVEKWKTAGNAHLGKAETTTERIEQ